MVEYAVVGRYFSEFHQDGNFAKSLAKNLDAQYVGVKLATFPDNEIKPVLNIKSKDDLKGRNVIIVSRTDKYNPRPNDAIIELGLTVKNVASLGANKIDIVMPWMYYSRQDESFVKGEPSSLPYIASLYEGLSNQQCPIENLITLNSHVWGKSRPLKESFSSINVHDLSSSGIFADYFSKKNLSNTVILSPGARELAKELSDKLEVPYENLRKPRSHRTQRIKMYPPKTDVEGKDVIILDDLSSSGGTVLKAVEIAKRKKANIMNIALTHFMTWEGISKVCEFVGPGKVVTTDSLDSTYLKHYMRDYGCDELSTTSMFSNYIKKI
jgi:ribose-phosphate pyrophosphokinase